MENVLIIWLNGALVGLAEIAVKEALKRDYSIEERDLLKSENGLEFVFDDETGGKARIEFVNDDPHLSVKITTDFSWEAIPLYELVQNCFDDSEGEA